MEFLIILIIVFHLLGLWEGHYKTQNKIDALEKKIDELLNKK